MGIWNEPTQRFGPELLDGPTHDRVELGANLDDMALANQALGSNRSMLRHLTRLLAHVPASQRISVLDIATGAGGVPRLIGRWARHVGRQVRLIASDLDATVVGIADEQLRRDDVDIIRHDALHLPFADASVEVVTCAFALHHFNPSVAVGVLREMARVARIGIVVSDLRRSYLAYWGARALALVTPNRLSRHDGPLSVLRAYTPREVQALLMQAGIQGRASAEPLFRLTIAARTQA